MTSEPLLKRTIDRLGLATGLGETIGPEIIRVYFLQFIALAIGMVGNIFVARWLGPSEKGLIDLFHVLTSFIQDIGALGFGAGVLYALTFLKAPLPSVHGAAIAFSVLNGFVTAMLGFALIVQWQGVFPGMPAWTLYLCFALSPLIYYKLVWSSLLISLNQAAAMYRIAVALAFANLIAILLLFVTHRLSVNSVFLLTAITIAINAFVSLGWLLRRELRLEFNLSILKRSFGQGLIFYAGIVANLLHFKIDQILINHWYGSHEVGLYAVGVRWAELLFLLDSALITASLGRLSVLTEVESVTLIKQMFRAQLKISGLAAVAVVVLAYPLVLLLYGRDYQGAILPMMCLVPGVLAWSLSKIFSTKLNYQSGRGALVTFIAILGLVINIALNLILLKILRVGIVGAAFSSSVSYSAVLLAVWWMSRKSQNKPPVDEVRVAI